MPPKQLNRTALILHVLRGLAAPRVTIPLTIAA